MRVRARKHAEIYKASQIGICYDRAMWMHPTIFPLKKKIEKPALYANQT